MKHQRREVKSFNKKETLCWSAGLGLAILLLFLYLFVGFGHVVQAPLYHTENMLKAALGAALLDNMWSLMAAQLSLTFISVSVLSVLSDKDRVIYWKDLVEERLLRPRFGCFAAYTYYSVTASVISCMAVLFQCAALFLFAFCANIVVLILLTDSILDVYFCKEKHTKKLQAELEAAYWEAFQTDYKNRSQTRYYAILNDFATQIQRHKDDALYMREVFDLIVQRIELFDTDHPAVRKVLDRQFDSDYRLMDLRPFEIVVSKAEQWAKAVQAGNRNVVYTADWIFWVTAVNQWRKTQCFADCHSHSVDVYTVIELEKLLNRRLEALIACERAMAKVEEGKAFALQEESAATFPWVKHVYFYLVQALFGGYAALYGKRLERYYEEKYSGMVYDKNVDRCFPGQNQALAQLTALIQTYGDLYTHLHPYGPQVMERFLSIIPKE